MGTITAILPSVRPPGRVVVEVDGRAVVTVALETIERLLLRTGAPYEPVRGALERDAAILHVQDRALSMLAARGRASRELRRVLERKGEPAELVDVVIERLVRAGYLDDAAYARSVAHAKAVGQGHSRRRVKQELFKRGVDPRVADAAIAETFDEEELDEGALVEQAARKKLPSLAALPPEVRDRRLYAFLARRGFDGDAIRSVMRRVTRADLSDAADDGDEIIGEESASGDPPDRLG